MNEHNCIGNADILIMDICFFRAIGTANFYVAVSLYAKIMQGLKADFFYHHNMTALLIDWKRKEKNVGTEDNSIANECPDFYTIAYIKNPYNFLTIRSISFTPASYGIRYNETR